MQANIHPTNSIQMFYHVLSCFIIEIALAGGVSNLQTNQQINEISYIIRFKHLIQIFLVKSC